MITSQDIRHHHGDRALTSTNSMFALNDTGHVGSLASRDVLPSAEAVRNESCDLSLRRAMSNQLENKSKYNGRGRTGLGSCAVIIARALSRIS